MLMPVFMDESTAVSLLLHLLPLLVLYTPSIPTTSKIILHHHRHLPVYQAYPASSQKSPRPHFAGSQSLPINTRSAQGMPPLTEFAFLS